jgi:hypothetical protein
MRHGLLMLALVDLAICLTSESMDEKAMSMALAWACIMAVLVFRIYE